MLKISEAIAPPFLKPGDRVGIVSTARFVTAQDIEMCISAIQSWGLRPVLSRFLFNQNHQFAGTDEERMVSLQEMMNDSTLSAILCARGGYGTLKMLDKIDFSHFAKEPKWIVGFSDVTPLLHTCAHHGVQAIHGPMAISFKGGTADENAQKGLKKFLMGETGIQYEYTPSNEQFVKPGLAEGNVVGGNLSLLSHMIGTPSDFETKDCILFFEDVSEYLYSIDRMILHLERAGKLNQLKGMIMGGMTDLKDNDTPFGKTPPEIAMEYLQGKQYPFASEFPAGHQPNNFPIVIGRRGQLQVTHSKITFLQ